MSWSARATMYGGRWYLRLCFALCILLPLTLAAWSKSVDEKIALQVARAWLADNPAPMVQNPGKRQWTARGVHEFLNADGMCLAYIVDLKPQGYIVVPADDEIEPILAFSTEGNFTGNIGPTELLSDVLVQDIPTRLAKKAQMAPAYRNAVTERWGKLKTSLTGDAGEMTTILDGQTGTSTLSQTVSPLVSTRWDQGSASGPYYLYNYYTPNHYPAGCVPVAMAMLIRYFKYPSQASCSGGIYVDGVYRSASFNSSYDYSLMPDFLTYQSPSTQIQEVSKLIYNCGISLNSSYASGGTSASTATVPSLLVNIFKYGSAAWKNGSDSDWSSVLKQELSATYPVQMAISSTASSAGHSIVCDGYGTDSTSSTLFHLNWGWGGSYNGWYSVPNMVTGTRTWDVLKGYVYNIRTSVAPPPPPTTTYAADMLIRNSSSSSYSGDGIINVDASQTATQTVNAGSTAIYYLKAQNGGTSTDNLCITGPAAVSGWTVRFYDTLSGGTEITSQVTSSGWTISGLASGASREFRVEVTPASTVTGGTSYAVRVKATSVGNTAKYDTVLATTTTTLTQPPATSTYSPDLMICNSDDPTYDGEGIYNLDSAQTALQTIDNGVTAVFYLKVQNSGSSTDSIRITGPSGGNGWTVRYYNAHSGGYDVTSSITYVGWTISNTAIGAYREFRVEITPTSTVPSGETLSVRVNATSINDTTKRDAVIATVSASASAAPIAANGTLTTTEDTAGTGTLIATDADLDALTYAIVANGTKGTVVITEQSTGAFRYTPNANATGTDTFTFKAFDGTLYSNVATVTVTISPVNDAPVAVADSYNFSAYGTATVSAPGVLANDTDIDSTALTAVLVSGPSDGLLTLNANGSFTYTPDAAYTGNDAFTYKVYDGLAYSAPVTVSIIMTILPPVAVDDTAQSVNGAPVTINVLANDSNVTGTPPVTTVTPGAHGQVVLNPDSTVTYTPTSGFAGTDTFTYTVQNAAGVTATATVSVTVTQPTIQPLTAVTLATDLASPQLLNTAVKMTATPTGGTNVEYRFRLGTLDSTGTWQWTDLREYTADPTFTWSTDVAGTYSLMVYAREAGSTAAYDVYAKVSYTIYAPLTAVTLSANPASGPTGVKTVLTATPTGGKKVEYKFWAGYLQSNHWRWSVIRDYSTDPNCNWTPSAAVKVSQYSLSIWAREVGNTNSYDVNGHLVYAITAATTTTTK